MMGNNRCCGNCDLFEESPLVKEVGKCIMTKEIKQIGAYCQGTDYFQPKQKETPEGAVK